MKEIVCVKLENDMDLILAHKRAMRLCELTGFSTIAQTSIATAISEIARCAIEYGKNAQLILAIEVIANRKLLKAIIEDSTDFNLRCADAIQYAKRLVDDVEVLKSAKKIQIVLKQQLSFAGTLTESKLESFVAYFKNEPPLSAYDELRRKNLLLQEFADKLKESETEYRVLTDTLPLMMFSVNNRGVITYTNKWLQNYLGNLPKELNSNSWQNFIHPGDYSIFSKDLNNALIRQNPLSGQYRFKEKSSGNYLWHMVSVIPLKNEKEITLRWIGFIVDIHAQKVVEQTSKDNRELKETQLQLIQNQGELQQKVIELNRSNYELEQFAHLASHDLQEPLRKLFFYSDTLKRKYSSAIDESGKNMLNNMTLAAGRMKELISDLLSYSQLQQQQLQFEEVDLNSILAEIVKDLDVTIKEKGAVIHLEDLPLVPGNKIRLTQLFTNLIGNSLKYSKKDTTPVIEVTVIRNHKNAAIRVKDNGIGFDEQYSEKIFGLFERLHTRDQIPGTGIGLSICRKIAELHNGSISATSVPGEYSVFEVNLPVVAESIIQA
jgi:PAS domain S-box-containing protein